MYSVINIDLEHTSLIFHLFQRNQAFGPCACLLQQELLLPY